MNARHFRTDHLLPDLRTRAISGGLVTTAGQGAKFVLNLTAAVVLARLLTPVHYGLVAMVSGVTVFLGLFKDAGLSTATVQTETITQGQVSNLFWINVALGGVLSLLSASLAPAVAWFYGDARLVGIMLALSCTFLLTGSTVQHHALLNRQMRFKAEAIIDVGSMLAGTIAACCLALSGFGYWSLVGMYLCTAGTELVLTWWASGWWPTLPSRKSGVRPLLRFGAHMTASAAVARLARGSDSILIGRFFGAGPLGLYSRASVLLVRPLEQLLSPTGAVLIPVLSRLQSDPERYRRTFLRANDGLAVVSFLMTALMLALSRPLILVLLGPAWEGAVPLFAGFTLAALYIPLATAATWLFTSQGRGRDWLQVTVILSSVTIASYFVGLPFGVLGVVVAFSASGLLVRLPVLYYLAGRRGPVSTADLWKGFLHNVPCWLAVYASTTLASTVVGNVSPIEKLLLCGSVGLAVGAGAVLVFERPRLIALYAVEIIKGSLANHLRYSATSTSPRPSHSQVG
jgi:O-antigen/teichoic acid export membrane protein